MSVLIMIIIGAAVLGGIANLMTFIHHHTLEEMFAMLMAVVYLGVVFLLLCGSLLAGIEIVTFFS